MGRHNDVRELLFGSGLSFSVKIVSAIITFMMHIKLARVLGPKEAGLFFLGLTIVTLISSFGQLGLKNSLVRFVARDSEVGNWELVRAVFRKSIFWSGLFCLFILLIFQLNVSWLVDRYSNQAGFEQVIMVISYSIPLVALYTLCAHSLQGLKEVVKAMITLNLVVPLTLLSALIFFPVYRAADMAYVYIAASAIALLIGSLWWFWSIPLTHKTAKFSSKLLLNSSLPLWCVMVLNQLINWSSQLIIGYSGSSEDVALFTVAQRTAMLAGFVLIAVNSIAAPKFAVKYSQGDMVGLRKVAIWSVRLMLLIALPILLFMLFFPEWLMGLFGEDYRIAAKVLTILALGQFVNIVSGSVGFLLTMTGHERELYSTVFISAVLAIGLSIWLVPTYGILGGAIATAVALAVQNLLGVFKVRRLLGFNTLVFWQKI